MEHPCEMFEYARVVAEDIAEYRYQGWHIEPGLSHEWEAILDGSYALEANYPELEVELADYASNWRTTYFKMLKSKIASSSELILANARR